MKSYWENFRKNGKQYPKITEDINTDVCIIGGGLSGLSVAYYLSKKIEKELKQKLDVVILEKNNICSGTSAKNTGKVTSQHGLFYDYLVNSKDREFVQKYLEANQNAIQDIETIVNTENINCDFKRESAYVFTNNDKKLDNIKKEYKTVNNLRSDLSNYSENIDIPIACKGAIEFKNQAKIHPLKYVYGLADAVTKKGVKIFENSKVINIQKEAEQYSIEVNGKIVKAKYVVLTTRYPILSFPGYYFLKMYQSTSYAMVFDCKEQLFEGMYINAETPNISFRIIEEKDKKLLLVVGYDYKTGIPEENGYNEIEKIVKSMYPKAEIISKWSAEDSISLDKIPYIGEYSNLMKNMYIATGFNKWGLTSSNIAGQIIADKILNIDNKYESIFKATRLQPIKNREELSNMIKEANNSIILSKFKIPKEHLNSINIDEGKIINVNGTKIGVYKDTNGEIHKVKPVCTHLGCELNFNNIDKIWECPCHGSKFTYDGKSIETPSNQNLEN